MPYVLIGVAILVLELYGLMNTPVSFGFIPLAVRLLVPPGLALIGLRSASPNHAAEVLAAALLFILMNAPAGRSISSTVAVSAVAILLIGVGLRADADMTRRRQSYLMSFSGVIAIVILLALAAAFARHAGMFEQLNTL